MSRYSKFIAAALAFLGVVVSSGVLHGQAQAVVSCVVSALGAAVVYLVPNQPTGAKRGEVGGVDLKYVLVCIVLALAAVALVLFIFGPVNLHL